MEFIEIMEQRTGKKTKIRFDGWRPSDQRVYISDISKVKRTLGWSPKIDIREGAKILIDWIRENETKFKF